MHENIVSRGDSINYDESQEKNILSSSFHLFFLQNFLLNYLPPQFTMKMVCFVTLTLLIASVASRSSFHRMNVDGKSLLDVASWGKEDTPLNSYRDNEFFLAIDWVAAVTSLRDKALRMLPGYRFAYNIFRWRKQLYGSL